MSNIKIVIFSGSYNNWDVYENVLSYVASKENPSGYGFWGNTVQDYANQFQTSCSLSSQEEDQNIWHFCISSRFFSSNKYSSLALANQIAQIFKDHFQIMYAYDGKKTNHPHIHFAVNAYSYYPTVPALTKARFTSYLEKVKLLLRNEYPNTEVQILFKEDSQNV